MPYPSGCADPVEQHLEPLSFIEHLALRVFNDCATQWNIVAGLGGGGRTGLDYLKVESVARAHGLAWNEDLLAMIGVCERTVIEADAKQRQADKTASELASNVPQGRE